MKTDRELDKIGNEYEFGAYSVKSLRCESPCW
jgi:hypothetical protein